MSRHTDGKWSRSVGGTKKSKKPPPFSANLQPTKQKQQWCFLCGEIHDYHEGDNVRQ